jgi:ribosome maturation factor RimP
VAIDAHALETFLEPLVEAQGFDLVRVLAMSGTGRRLTIQVMAERPEGGMSVEDCARLSRVLSDALDAADPVKGEYVLEVSSPGIDRPLTRPRDFERFAGEEIRVETSNPVAGRRRFKGRLLGLEDDEVTIACDDGEFRLSLANVAKAKLVMNEALLKKGAGQEME